MRVIKATIPMIESRVLIIGFVGENERTQVRIDCTGILTEYPHASPSLAIKPPVGAVYPVVVSRDDNDVVWNVSNADLQNEGYGELQLTFVKDGVVAKTVIGKLRISRSLLVTGEQPDVIQTWYDAATEKLAEVDAQIVELEGMVDTATDAATRAEQSASTASAKAEQAAGSAATATAKATEATNAAGTATAKATEAALSATQASNSAMSAADSERGAIAKAGEATTAAGTATAKAEQATEAAQTATEKAGDASASARAAHASEISAAESADDALAAKTAAEAAKRAAEASATQAAQSAQGASADAQTATQKAAEATQSATDSATFAGTATTKAEEATEAAQAASDAKTAVEETAEQLADSLEQIAQNTQDIAELDDRKANIDGYYPDMTVGNAEQLNSSKYVENSEPYTFRTSGGTSDIGNREYLDAVVGGTVAWNQKVRNEASENSTDFAPIVTVTDAVEDAAGVKVKIEPVQDLHGYDHPWPAGGGKNLLHVDSRVSSTVAGVTYTSDDDYIYLNGTKYGQGYVTLTQLPISLEPGTYYARAFAVGGTSTNRIYIYANNGNADIGGDILAAERTYTVAETTTFVFRFLLSNDGTVLSNYKIGIVISKTDAIDKFYPYSNICPITGWDGVKVTRTGKNLWNKDDLTAKNGYYNLDGSFNMNPTWRAIAFSCQQGFTYTKSGDGWGGIVTYWYDDTFVSSTNNSTVTVPSGVNNVRFACQYSSTNAQLELSSTATDYEPYSGNTYSITLPTEAGTVYGGELTVNADGSGSLVVDTVKAIADGTIAPTAVTDAHTAQFGSKFPLAAGYSLSETALKCNRLKPSNYSSAIDNLIFFPNATIVTMKVSAEVTDWVSWLSNNPVEFSYKIANPQTYTLTASQIRTLLGENNVWADTGDLALTYTGTDEHLTLESGKKYLARLSGTDSMLLGSGQEITAVKGTDNVFDLTQMFGTAVADYVYGQGASFFRKWFGGSHYPYNAGELRHVEGLSAHEMVGFNAWDEEMELGYYDINTGEKKATSSQARSKNPIPVLPNTRYFATSSKGLWGLFYDGDGKLIEGWSATTTTAGNASLIYGSQSIDGFLTPPNAASLSFYAVTEYGTTYKHDICIFIAHNGSRKGEYEPYEKHSYPLDSSVILRGVPKVGANGVYWDGDRYLPDGTVERRYGVVDLGTLNWVIGGTYRNLFYALFPSAKYTVSTSNVADNIRITKYDIMPYSALDVNDATTKGIALRNTDTTIRIKDPSYVTASDLKASLSGVYLVYELADPTTETAQPYHSTQWVNDWGTEEFVSTGIVPVGSETRYPANLRDKLQHLPDAASGNGSYLITQTDGQMVLTPFPAPPSTAGNYVLKATVTNGVATYTWEVAT